MSQWWQDDPEAVDLEGIRIALLYGIPLYRLGGERCCSDYEPRAVSPAGPGLLERIVAFARARLARPAPAPLVLLEGRATDQSEVAEERVA